MIIPIEAEALSKDNASEHNDANSSVITNDLALTTTTSSYLPNSSHSKLARTNQLKYILGLVYIQEFLPHGTEQRGSEEISIGTLILAEHRTIYAHQLRQMIVQQSLFNMDNNYVFLTNFGHVRLHQLCRPSSLCHSCFSLDLLFRWLRKSP